MSPEEMTEYLNNEPENKSRSVRIKTLIILLSVALCFSVFLFLDAEHKQITIEQRTVLTSLVSKLSAQTGESKTRIWSRVKKHIDVRRIDQINKGQYDEAVDLLTTEITP